MAINTCIGRAVAATFVMHYHGGLVLGFYWRQMMTDTGVEEDAWGYLIVCVPVVVIFAPLGSIISSHFHRLLIFNS